LSTPPSFTSGQAGAPLPGPSDLDAYVDGTLGPAARAEFERKLTASPLLRAELELQRRIDGSLRRMLTPDSGVGGGPVGKIGPASPPARRSRWVVWSGLAAALALVGVVAWMLTRPAPVPVRQIGSAPQHTTPLALYQFEKKHDWEIAWKCDTDEQFAAAVKEKLGRPLLLSKDSGYQVAGWIYSTSPLLGPTTMALVAEVEGTHVLVAFDHAQEDRTLEVPADSGLHLFRREADGMVFYEISPLERSGVVDHFYDPDQRPASPAGGGPPG
jgi:hypothetical protein